MTRFNIQFTTTPSGDIRIGGLEHRSLASTISNNEAKRLRNLFTRQLFDQHGHFVIASGCEVEMDVVQWTPTTCYILASTPVKNSSRYMN